MDNIEEDILITKKHIAEYSRRFGLRKILSGIHLWGIGVGTVIAGTFFGWNYGLEQSGSLGFFITTLIVTSFYLVLTFLFSELSILFPYAGGPYAYVRKGLGTFGGYLTGIFTISEFLCASSAVTISIASYISYCYPSIPKMYVAMGVYLIFLAIDILGIKQSAIFQLTVTSIAISTLVIFFISTLPSVDLSTTFAKEPFINGYKGIIQAIPFALWFYVCIEGISLAAEETKNPKIDMLFGFKSSIWTVVIFNLGVLIFCLSSVDWKVLLSNDYPLSSVLKIVQPGSKISLMVFTTLALSSLLASLHGMMNGFSRQTFALSRAGYLPKFLSRIHPITKTPYLAIILPGMIGMTLAYHATARTLVFTAGLSALLMYVLVISSYLKFKMHSEQQGKTKFRVKWFILLCFIALILFVLVFLYIKNSDNTLKIAIFFLIIVLYYIFIGRKFIVNDAPEEREAQDKKIIIR